MGAHLNSRGSYGILRKKKGATVMDYGARAKENFQKQLDILTEGLSVSGARPRLLLHSCCAPCSSYVLEYLLKFFDVTVFYYNPNISPAEE